MTQNTIQIQYYHSPCGEIILGSYNKQLCLCDCIKNSYPSIADMRVCKSLNHIYQIWYKQVFRTTF